MGYINGLSRLYTATVNALCLADIWKDADADSEVSSKPG
ncbi:hypothetical protein PC129_g19594 [Phytophthora cactorum]|uniref:Uncharacterized protein n=1 Tax=Phytophthora cactorum TaxID=29920 RepID=A0A8T1BGR1_9STRA|nr:hypothetical protein PC117_g21399 [Phytophthora cactorum]KAG2995331.1 hypothetical protein PC119_g18080 [Phytophthora cactorum]KAG3132322.1 hypothetical protein C6341_g22968 [Phytophthora cactorum]KAG3209395.1 hypothetical protein PC129_g19594 [Phytophthora cactorum]